MSPAAMNSLQFTQIPFILFLLLTLSRAQTPISTCPVVLPEPATRIVGGKLSTNSTALFMVAIVINGEPRCSGTLLSQSWVLTAEHCVNHPYYHYAVRVGSTEDDEGKLFPISDIYVPKKPPSVDSAMHDLPADIAVLKLSHPVPSSNYTFALLNSNDSVPLPRAYTRAIGYGNRIFDSETAGTLHQVDMQTQSLEACRNEAWWWLDDSWICTKNPLSTCSICHGDSGGPLVQYDAKGNPVVLGVAALSVDCEANLFANVHTRVSSYIPWMRSVGAQFETSSQPLQVFKEVKGPAASPSASLSPRACPVKIPHLPPMRAQAHSSVRLYKGAPASSATGRFMVSIYAGRACTGMLISRTWALTSSDCSVERYSTVYLGGRQSLIGYEARIKRTVKGRQGVTLIELFSNVLDTGSVVLVNSDDSVPPAGSFARVVAYGQENRYDNFTESKMLRQIDVPVVDPKQCKVNKKKLSSSLCTKPAEGGCALCLSDLGAPLLQFTDDGQPVIVGIFLGGSTCVRQSSPTLYIKTSSLVAWMRKSGAVFTTNNGTSPHKSAKPSIIPSPIPSGPKRTLHPSPSSSLTASASPNPSVTISPSPRCPEVLPQESPEERLSAIRIVGGKLSSANSARYMVSLQSTNGEQECSGVLLSSRWVLTSRYCGVKTSWMAYASSQNASGVFIEIGDVYYAPLRNDDFQFANVTVLKLAKDTPENSTTVLVNSNTSLPLTSAYGRVLGYGGSAPGEGRRLRQVDLPTLSPDICRPKFNTSNSLERNIADEMFCAGMIGCGACKGDRGAPLLQYEGSIPVVIGVLNGEGPCSSRDASHSFVRIAGLVSWMESIGVVFSTSTGAEQVFLRTSTNDNDDDDGIEKGGNRTALIAALSSVGGVLLSTVVIGLFVIRHRRETASRPAPDVQNDPT